MCIRDREDALKKQQETMALYRQYNVSPMGGCLPMLLQTPVFIDVYKRQVYGIRRCRDKAQFPLNLVFKLDTLSVIIIRLPGEAGKQ